MHGADRRVAHQHAPALTARRRVQPTYKNEPLVIHAGVRVNPAAVADVVAATRVVVVAHFDLRPVGWARTNDDDITPIPLPTVATIIVAVIVSIVAVIVAIMVMPAVVMPVMVAIHISDAPCARALNDQRFAAGQE